MLYMSIGRMYSIHPLIHILLSVGVLLIEVLLIILVPQDRFSGTHCNRLGINVVFQEVSIFHLYSSHVFGASELTLV